MMTVMMMKNNDIMNQQPPPSFRKLGFFLSQRCYFGNYVGAEGV